MSATLATEIINYFNTRTTHHVNKLTPKYGVKAEMAAVKLATNDVVRKYDVDVTDAVVALAS